MTPKQREARDKALERMENMSSEEFFARVDEILLTHSEEEIKMASMFYTGRLWEDAEDIAEKDSK